MGNTGGSSRGPFRFRLTAGGAVTAAGILAAGLVTAPPGTPPTATNVRATDIRTVQLAAATQQVMTPLEATLELSTITDAGTGLPELESVVVTPSRSRATAPKATLDEDSLALWLLQPLYDFGQLLPVAWQQYYYVLFWSPVAIVVTLAITAVENTVKAVLGLFGISVPATAALTSGPSEPSEPRTAGAAATRDALVNEPMPGNLAAEETTSPGPDVDVAQTPTDPTEPTEDAAAPTEVDDTPSTELDVEAEASMDADDSTTDATAVETDERSDSATTFETSESPEPESSEAEDESPDPAGDEDDGSAADESGSANGDSAEG